MTRTIQEIQEGIVQRLSRLTGVPGGAIDVHAPILSYGLDSVAVVALAVDLHAWLGVGLRENPLDNHPTIEALAQFLAEQTAE